jgi:hypothetical protein
LYQKAAQTVQPLSSCGRCRESRLRYYWPGLLQCCTNASSIDINRFTTLSILLYRQTKANQLTREQIGSSKTLDFNTEHRVCPPAGPIVAKQTQFATRRYNLSLCGVVGAIHLGAEQISVRTDPDQSCTPQPLLLAMCAERMLQLLNIECLSCGSSAAHPLPCLILTCLPHSIACIFPHSCSCKCLLFDASKAWPPICFFCQQLRQL